MSNAAPRETPASDEQELRALVGMGAWDEARRRLADLRSRGVSEPWMALLERIIIPTRARAVPSRGVGGTPESVAWLRANAHMYRGQWVALRAGELLGNHPDRSELHRDLEQRGLLDEALFVWLMEEMK